MGCFSISYCPLISLKHASSCYHRGCRIAWHLMEFKVLLVYKWHFLLSPVQPRLSPTLLSRILTCRVSPVFHRTLGNSMGQGNPSTMFANSQRQMPASLDSTAQTGHAKGADWQEEIYQKIKVMKETYFPEINEMYQRIAAMLQQHDSHPQQPKSEQLEKLEVFKAMLERLITFLQVSKNNITPSFKEKLGSYENRL